MIQKSDEQPDNDQQPIPDFQPLWFWAFCSLMLYKLGGSEAITLDRLEKFPIEEVPEVVYDRELKAWIMRLKPGAVPKIVVPNKISKRHRKPIIKRFKA